jgi:GntR family transcriptional regulator, rspAB operon transcriptional repressor
VREAFIKLAEEGLLEVRPQRGSYVRRISVQAVLDARFVREAIEADVVRRAAETVDAAGMDQLDAHIAAQRALAPMHRATNSCVWTRIFTARWPNWPGRRRSPTI